MKRSSRLSKQRCNPLMSRSGFVQNKEEPADELWHEAMQAMQVPGKTRRLLLTSEEE